MNAIKLSQVEMNSIVSEVRIWTSSTGDIPTTVDQTYKLGEELLVYNEDKNEFLGPIIVLDSTGRMTTVYNTETNFTQNLMPFNWNHNIVI